MSKLTEDMYPSIHEALECESGAFEFAFNADNLSQARSLFTPSAGNLWAQPGVTVK